MLNVEQFRALLKLYRSGIALDVELTGRSDAWLDDFFNAFERVDELAAEFLEDQHEKKTL